MYGRVCSLAGMALATALALSAMPAAPAAAAVTPNVLTYTEYTNNAASQVGALRCIGIANGWAGLWDCTGRNDQWWSPTGTPRWSGTWGGYFYQYINQSGQCLGVDSGSTAAKARIRGFTCLPAATDQYWSTALGGPHNIRFINFKSNLVIGTAGGSAANGTDLIQYAMLDSTHPDQYWTITAQRNG
jgi:hypothetical protein